MPKHIVGVTCPSGYLTLNEVRALADRTRHIDGKSGVYVLGDYTDVVPDIFMQLAADGEMRQYDSIIVVGDET